MIVEKTRPLAPSAHHPQRGMYRPRTSNGGRRFNRLQFVEVAGQSALAEFEPTLSARALKLAKAFLSVVMVNPREQVGKKMSNSKACALKLKSDTLKVVHAILDFPTHDVRPFLCLNNSAHSRPRFLFPRLGRKKLSSNYHRSTALLYYRSLTAASVRSGAGFVESVGRIAA